MSIIVSSASLNFCVITCDSTGAEEKRMRVYNQENEDLEAASPYKKKIWTCRNSAVSSIYDVKPLTFSHQEDNF